MKRTLVLATGAGAVLLLAAALDLVGIAELPFYTRGEPREALVVYEMAHDGSLILPMRNGDEIPSKPPLFHWLGLGVSRAVGEVSELTTRLPSATLAILLTLAVYFFAAAQSRIRCGWLGAIALATSFEWLRAARTARVDMTFTFFLSAALLLYARILGARSRSHGTGTGTLVAFYGCLAAAVLAKGPIGLVLPFLVIAIHAAVGSASNARTLDEGPSRGSALSGQAPTPSLLGRLQLAAREIHAGVGLVAVLLSTGLWYASAYAIGGDAFLEVHAFRENVFRVLDAERFGSGHVHGPLYLVGQFFLGTFPWGLSAPAIFWWLWRGRPLDETTRFLAIWFLVVFAFFLVPESKRGVYLLPAYPAAALLFGLVLGPGPEGRGPRALAAAGWLVGCALPALLGLAALVVASGVAIDEPILSRLRPHEASEVAASFEVLRSNGWQTACVGFLAIAASGAAALNAPGAHWLRASVPLVVALVLALGGLVAPVERTIAGLRTLAPFLPQVNARVGEETLSFAPGSLDYGAVYYAKRPIPLATSEPPTTAYVLTHPRRDGSLAVPGTVVLRSDGTGERGRAPMLLLETQP